MKRSTFIISIIPVIVLSTFIYAATSTKITIKGSDTMVLLAQRWAEEYGAKHPNISLQVTGGGSGTGISALINGTTDICTASRPMTNSERDKLKQRFSSLGVEVKTAKDGISLYVSESNTVDELTLKQIKDIYTGVITNWKDVGGQDSKIILYGRENSSGTYAYFRDFVLKGQDYSSMMQNLPGTAAVVNAVAHDNNGIGYGGAAYGKGIKYVKVKKDNAAPGYVPDAETIKTGTYPITRYLYFYVRNRPSGEIKEFIDWVLSTEGQEVTKNVGYFPVR